MYGYKAKFLVKSEKGITFGGSDTIEGARSIMKNQQMEYKDYPKVWGDPPVFHIEQVKEN